MICLRLSGAAVKTSLARSALHRKVRKMSTLGAILLILAGLAILNYGIFLFYAWLPVLYGLFGFEIGMLLGRSMTGDVGALAITLGVIGAVILFLASYFLEPYRRLLLGISGGAAVGLALASVFGWDHGASGLFAFILTVFGAVIGASVVPRYFDAFIIGASAFAGAAMVMAGAHRLLPGVGLFDRASGGTLPAIVTILLAVVGVGSQYRNIATAIRSTPLYGELSGMAVRDGRGH